jgi:hypothetical protein
MNIEGLQQDAEATLAALEEHGIRPIEAFVYLLGDGAISPSWIENDTPVAYEQVAHASRRTTTTTRTTTMTRRTTRTRSPTRPTCWTSSSSAKQRSNASSASTTPRRPTTAAPPTRRR